MKPQQGEECVNVLLVSVIWHRCQNKRNKKAQLTQRERTTAVHVCRPTANKCEIRKKPLILVLKVIQGHWFRCQSKPVYDFILVINCNLGPISHRFRDMATYWFKIAKFSCPLSFRALHWGDPYGILGKRLQILKLESLGQPMVKI